MLTFGLVLFHDNAFPHTAVRTRTLLKRLNWELFDHSPYSPNLAPSDHHLFTRTHLKNWLGSHSSSNNEELMEGVVTWLSSRAEDFIDDIKNLFPSRDYVEK
jgi:hypothetical protein